MSIFFGDNSANLVTSLEVNETSTVSVDITTLQNHSEYTAYWFTVSNSLESDNDFVNVSPQGSDVDGIYVYNGTAGGDHSTVNGDIASTAFYLPNSPLKNIDYGGNLRSTTVDPTSSPLYLSIWGWNGVYSNSHRFFDIEITVTGLPTPILFTPIYMGKAQVDTSGDLNFGLAVAKTVMWPADDHHLVARKFVMDGLEDLRQKVNDFIATTDDGKAQHLDRTSALEAQLERLYQALYQLPRDTESIVTAQAGALGATFEPAVVAEADPISPLDLPPVASGFQ